MMHGQRNIKLSKYDPRVSSLVVAMDVFQEIRISTTLCKHTLTQSSQHGAQPIATSKASLS